LGRRNFLVPVKVNGNDGHRFASTTGTEELEEGKKKTSDGTKRKVGETDEKNNNQKDVGVRVDLQANRDDSDNSKRKQVPVLRVSPSVKTAAEQQRPVE
jgi:hypothetical protein